MPTADYRKRMKSEKKCIDCGRPATAMTLCCRYHLLYRAKRARRYYTPKGERNAA